MPPCYAKNKAEPNFDIIWNHQGRQRSIEMHRFPNFGGVHKVKIGRKLTSSRMDRVVITYLRTSIWQKSIDCSLHVTSTPSYRKQFNSLTYPCLSQAATKEVWQKVIIVTFDLAVVRKAYNLLWQNDKFKDVFVRLGSFHNICSFFRAIRELVN